MGDLRLYTDQYYNQRIAGAGLPTIGVLRYQRIRIFVYRPKRAPRFVGYGEGHGVPVPEGSTWGDRRGAAAQRRGLLPRARPGR